MNKLLLLATSLICLTIPGFTTGSSINHPATALIIKAALKDSTVKESITTDPKTGFKDLFETKTINGINISNLNPLAVNFVQGYMGVYGNHLNRMKSWGQRYFEIISNVLTQFGLPAELKYLSVIESDLKSRAVSKVGAVGPWQFMPQTARDLGLKVNKHVDERRDFYKSTQAAARYLKELYGVFQDWLLVIAAYNSGPAHVLTAMHKAHSSDFWDLQRYLPAESRGHVKRFIATHYIMEGEGGVTTQTRSETLALQAPAPITILPGVSTATLSGKYTGQAIARNVEMDPESFNKLNPNFDRQLSATGSYTLHLPTDKMQLFEANKGAIIQASMKELLSAR